MAPLFDPLTVGFDWETWVTDVAGLAASEKEVQVIVEDLHRAHPRLPMGKDLGQVEMRSGILRSAEEIRSRAALAFDAVLKVVRARDREVYPFAGHPLVHNFAGGHVHVGSVYDMEGALRLRRALFPHVPALVALAAASPVTQLRSGEYKSYRTALKAYNCVMPVAPQTLAIAQQRGGEDVMPKMEQKPTIEVRCLDAATSPAVFADLATLAAGLVAALAERMDAGDEGPEVDWDRDPARYLEIIANRYNAARHGLQATFVRDGRPVEAAQAVALVLTLAEPGLRRLGAGDGDLSIVRRMVGLRQTQADWMRHVLAGSDDPFQGARRLLDARSNGGFEAYIEEASPLGPVPHETIEGAVRDRVRGWSPWTRINYEISVPPVRLWEILRTLAARGEIQLVRDPRRGLVALPASPAASGDGRRPCIGTWRRCSKSTKAVRSPAMAE